MWYRKGYCIACGQNEDSYMRYELLCVVRGIALPVDSTRIVI